MIRTMKLPILAIDPGTHCSAFCHYDNGPQCFDTRSNEEVLHYLRECSYGADRTLAIEMIACYGMSVGAEVFETCVWIGRFIEAWGGPWRFVYRRDVKLHLCNSARAKDANVAQALRDRFGAKGTKAKPGVLYGIRGDEWAALGVAVTAWDTWERELAAVEVAHVGA